MTVVQNEATLSEKHQPGTGSSPKTAGSQSDTMTTIAVASLTYFYIFYVAIIINKEL